MALESVAIPSPAREPELNITSEQHENADNRLVMAQGILALIEAAMPSSTDDCVHAEAICRSAWAAQTLIEDARLIYGKA